MRSTRRSEMFASSATAIARQSSAKATGWPWKFPFETISRSLEEDERIVGGSIDLDRDRALDVVEQVAARAVHLRRAAQRVRVLHLVAPAVRLEDRRAVEQAAHVRGRRDLAGVRTRSVNRRVEARAASPAAPRATSRRRRRQSATSRSARVSPSEAIAAMNWVPLMSDRPSFACSLTGVRPAAASASAPGMRAPSTNASPSPTSGSARWASGARSPLAPTEPRAGTCGTIPALSTASSSSTVSTRAPE